MNRVFPLVYKTADNTEKNIFLISSYLTIVLGHDDRVWLYQKAKTVPASGITQEMFIFLQGGVVLPEGTVKWFSDKKGYGFIEQEDGSDVFVHHSSIDMPGFRTLSEGERVSFEIETSGRGSAAKNVIKL